jgi:hypothetical protein
MPNLVYRYKPIDKSSLETSLEEAIEYLKKEFANLPADATNATLDISTERDYGGGEYACISIAYYSPETEEEKTQRKKVKERLKEYERKQYEILKKKFEK